MLSTSAQVEAGTTLVDLSTADLAAGVYLVHVTIDGASKTMKLQVKEGFLFFK